MLVYLLLVESSFQLFNQILMLIIIKVVITIMHLFLCPADC